MSKLQYKVELSQNKTLRPGYETKSGVKPGLKYTGGI